MTKTKQEHRDEILEECKTLGWEVETVGENSNDIYTHRVLAFPCIKIHIPVETDETYGLVMHSLESLIDAHKKYKEMIGGKK